MSNTTKAVMLGKSFTITNKYEQEQKICFIPSFSLTLSHFYFSHSHFSFPLFLSFSITPLYSPFSYFGHSLSPSLSLSQRRRRRRKSTRSIMANVLDSSLEVNKFEFHWRYCIHLRSNALGKAVELHYLCRDRINDITSVLLRGWH